MELFVAAKNNQLAIDVLPKMFVTENPTYKKEGENE
jgi:hypothetical protein